MQADPHWITLILFSEARATWTWSMPATGAAHGQCLSPLIPYWLRVTIQWLFWRQAIHSGTALEAPSQLI